MPGKRHGRLAAHPSGVWVTTKVSQGASKALVFSLSSEESPRQVTRIAKKSHSWYHDKNLYKVPRRLTQGSPRAEGYLQDQRDQFVPGGFSFTLGNASRDADPLVYLSLCILPFQALRATDLIH
ncbi:MAG: hypothetical protein RIQ41_583 [Candidatus Parcubacteria bacterium]